MNVVFKYSRDRPVAGLLSVLALGVAAFLQAGEALATPRPLPFTYNYETLGEGELEVEQYVDLVPLQVQRSGSPTKQSKRMGTSPMWVPAAQFQTEFEYGISNHLELGLYVTIAPTVAESAATNFVYATPPMTEGTGVKQRLRYRFFEEGKLPVDMDVYGELTETQDEFEIEAKLILQKRFGNLRIAANIVGEHDWLFATPEQDWVFHPTAGLTYQVTPLFQPGVDAWMWLERTNTAVPPLPDNSTPLNFRPNVYVGPAVLLNFGKLWWSTGAYLRVSSFGYDSVAEKTVGYDAFGPVWFRTIIGLTL